jgi:branched-chain amino acid transport system permease protein
VAARLAPLLAAAALVALPPLMPKYALEVLISILFFGYLGACWNILGGYGGQFSFGHAAFFGLGAYTSTLLFLHWGVSPWIGMLAGGLLAAGFGLFAGYLSFRYGLRGAYFSLVTLAVAEMLRVVAVNWKAVGSSLGLVVPNRGSAPALFLFAEKLPYYYVILTMAVGALVITRAMERSRMGYALAAIRENEDAAEAAGVDALSTKLPAIVGGAGTVTGPLLGSFVLTPISELTRAALRGRAGADIMLYGLVLILVISFLPNGLVGWIRARRAPAGGRR